MRNSFFIIAFLFAIKLIGQCDQSNSCQVQPFDNSNIQSSIQKLSDCANQKVDVILFGDSNVTPEIRMSGPLKEYFWNQGCYRGTGWHSAAGFNFNPLGTWKSQSAGIEELRQLGFSSQEGGGIINDAAKMNVGQFIQYNVLAGQQGSTAEQVDIWYESGTGDFQYQIDQGSFVFVENSTGNGDALKVNYNHGSVAEFTVRVEPLENAFIHYGINRFIDQNGVLIHKAGFSGYGAAYTPDLINIPSWQTIINDLDPDLVTVTLGSNQTGFPMLGTVDMTPAAFVNDMTNFLNAIEANTNADIAYLGFPPRRDYFNPIPSFPYFSNMYPVTKDNDWGYANLWYHHGNHVDVAVQQGWLIQDSVHYSVLGGQHNLELLKDLLELP